MDTQGHAGKSLGVDVRGLHPTVHEWLLGEVPFEAAVRPTAVPGLDLLPANKALAGAAGGPRRGAGPGRPAGGAPRRRCRPAATTRCCIDSPPSRSLVTENVLRAADAVVVPVALTYLALDGCAEMVESLRELEAARGRAPALALVVPALYRKTQLADEILAKLAERVPAPSSRAPCSAGRSRWTRRRATAGPSSSTRRAARGRWRWRASPRRSGAGAGRVGAAAGRRGRGATELP